MQIARLERNCPRTGGRRTTATAGQAGDLPVAMPAGGPRQDVDAVHTRSIACAAAVSLMPYTVALTLQLAFGRDGREVRSHLQPHPRPAPGEVVPRLCHTAPVGLTSCRHRGGRHHRHAEDRGLGNRGTGRSDFRGNRSTQATVYAMSRARLSATPGRQPDSVSIDLTHCLRPYFFLRRARVLICAWDFFWVREIFLLAGERRARSRAGDKRAVIVLRCVMGYAGRLQRKGFRGSKSSFVMLMADGNAGSRTGWHGEGALRRVPEVVRPESGRAALAHGAGIPSGPDLQALLRRGVQVRNVAGSAARAAPKDAGLKVSTNTLYVDQKLGQLPDQKLGRPEHFSRLPDSVLMDPELLPTAKMVYAFLAGRTRGASGTATAGERLIARSLSLSRTTVSCSISALESRGHLVPKGSGKQRRSYSLTSAIFRRDWFGSSAGEVIRYSRDGNDGPVYKQIVKSRKTA